MKISDLNIPKPCIKFLQDQGYSDLYPPQEESIKAGLLKEENILVSAPTASGKTLIATLAIINHLFSNKKKIVYLSPLRALASEKFEEFRKLESIDFGRKIKVKLSTGDFDSLDKNLEKGDIIVLTNEKMDSIIRHGTEWIDEIGLVIADEVHLIGDDERGPTLEIILARLKSLGQKPQILALSATITNAAEIASWLDCKSVKNEWRPVPLSEGVYDHGVVMMQDGRNFEIKSSIRGPTVDLGVESVKNGGQSLLFAETRARSASAAAKAADVIEKVISQKERKELDRISQKILNNNERTKLIKTLADLVKKGVAFHHAGLTHNCRETIESEFRNGKIKLLASTPTLAAGVNLPARRVVISTINRYDSKLGTNKPISVLEYKQLCGRAGRPQYDEFGEAIIVGNSNGNELLEDYVNGIPEPIVSKLTDDKALRTHVLSLIATTPGIKKEEIIDFFLGTLGGFQSSKTTIKFRIQIAIRFLTNEEMILKKGERYIATAFGKKVSMLYIDPLTASYFRIGLRTSSKEKKHTLGFLHLITNCDEFLPKFSLRNKDYETIGTLLDNHAPELIEPTSEYDCSRSLLAMYSWINEYTEKWLADDLGIEAGDIHRMVETGDWLVYSLYELAKQEDRVDLLEEINLLRTRISYGIKEELVELIRVPGIGRIRARTLYKHGIKNLNDLSKVPVKKLAEIDKIGSTLADNIKLQLRKVR
ncbi:MAG: DEAD/DEAH box helicase [Nitrosopumilaceae archaeon]